MRLGACVALSLLLLTVCSSLSADTQATSAADHFALAESYQVQGQSDEAVAEIKAGLLLGKAAADLEVALKVLDAIRAANLAPSAGLLVGIGDCYRIASHFAKAVPCYEAVLGKAELPAEEGKRVRRWLITCHIRNREWAKVEKEIDAIAAESPDCAAWAYYSLGKFHNRYRRYSEAIADLTKAMPPDKAPPATPSPKDIQCALVEAYTGARQWEKAAEVLTKLAALYPAEAAHWHECSGAIYQGQKKYAEAIVELKQAIEPKAAITARKRLGECYRDSMKPADAAPLIQELVVRYPGDGPYLPTVVGLIYQGLKEYDKAIADFKLVAERFPESRWQVWDACYYLGQCMYAQGKGEDALAYIRSIYAQRPNYPVDLAIAYGRTLMHAAKDYRRAATVFEEAVIAHPKDPLIHTVKRWLVDSLQIDGQYEKAATWCRAFFTSETKPDLAVEWDYKLATIPYSQQDWKSARDRFQALIDKYGRGVYVASALYMVGDCEAKIGNYAGAQAAFSRLKGDYPNSLLAAQAAAKLSVLPASPPPPVNRGEQ